MTMNNYFAYGSNLNIKQMKTRCPSAEIYGKGYLKEYELIFPRKHRNWPAGVASVGNNKEKTVEGVIYQVSDEDLLKLDEAENLKAEEYFRNELIIETEQASINAWVYIANPMEEAPYLPDNSYMDRIISGAKQHSLSDAYIRSLIEIETQIVT